MSRFSVTAPFLCSSIPPDISIWLPSWCCKRHWKPDDWRCLAELGMVEKWINYFKKTHHKIAQGHSVGYMQSAGHMLYSPDLCYSINNSGKSFKKKIYIRHELKIPENVGFWNSSVLTLKDSVFAWEVQSPKFISCSQNCDILITKKSSLYSKFSAHI